MIKLPRFAKRLSLLALVLSLPGCITQRTVTKGGQTVEQGWVVKRPLKEAVQNSN